MPRQKHKTTKQETAQTDKIEIDFSDLSPAKTEPINNENETTEPFMGLEDLFWQCYGVHPKQKH